MRARLLIAVAAGLVAVAACSDTSGNSASTPPTASITIATASSTTVAAATSTTVRPTTSATTSSSTSTSTSSSSTSSTSTVAATSTTAAPTTAAPAGFTPTSSPAVPDVTHPIDASWVDPASQQLLSVDDGQYWGTAAGTGVDAGVKFVTFRLVQVFFGDACTAQFGDDGCDNDYATLETPTGTVPMFFGAGRITVADPSTQDSYEIGGDTLAALLADPTAQVGAPAGYIYAPFAYLLQVQGGQITSAEQVWTP